MLTHELNWMLLLDYKLKLLNIYSINNTRLQNIKSVQQESRLYEFCPNTFLISVSTVLTYEKYNIHDKLHALPSHLLHKVEGLKQIPSLSYLQDQFVLLSKKKRACFLVELVMLNCRAATVTQQRQFAERVARSVTLGPFCATTVYCPAHWFSRNAVHMYSCGAQFELRSRHRLSC
jgi:hypothetical protein